MFKWLRKKLLKGLIQDIITELPEPDLLKQKMFEIFNKYKDEILEKLWKAIKDFVVDFIKKKMEKKWPPLYGAINLN